MLFAEGYRLFQSAKEGDSMPQINVKPSLLSLERAGIPFSEISRKAQAWRLGINYEASKYNNVCAVDSDRYGTELIRPCPMAGTQLHHTISSRIYLRLDMLGSEQF